ncbi:MAG: DMT family transporter [Rhodospirillaceae bacterium]
MMFNFPFKGLTSLAMPLFLLMSVGILWGLFFSLIKLAVSGGIHPVNYVFWFTLISGGLLVSVCLIRRKKFSLSREHLSYYFKIGLIRFSIANIFFYAAQGKLPVGAAAVIMAFTPIFTYSISLLLRVESFIWLRVLGIILGVIGVMLIVIPRASLPDASLTPYVFICFGAPLLHALGYVLLSEKSRPKNVDSMMIAGGTLLAASFSSFFIALLWGEWDFIFTNFDVPTMAMLTHAILAALNFFMIFELIRIAGPTFMSQSSNLALGFGVFFGWLIFGELPSHWVWGAITLILIGVALVNTRHKEP